MRAIFSTIVLGLGLVGSGCTIEANADATPNGDGAVVVRWSFDGLQADEASCSARNAQEARIAVLRNGQPQGGEWSMRCAVGATTLTVPEGLGYTLRVRLVDPAGVDRTTGAQSGEFTVWEDRQHEEIFDFPATSFF